MTKTSDFIPQVAQEDDGLRGLEGWLLIAILVIVLSALTSAWGAALLLLLHGPGSVQIMVALFYGLAALTSAFLAFSLIQEKSYARWMAVIFYGGFLVVSLVSVGTDMALGDRASTSGLSIAQEALRAITSAAWLLYFIFSRRVKLTLVK